MNKDNKKNNTMTPLEISLNILSGKKTPRPGVLNPVSSTTIEQMKMTGSYFPEAHTDAKKMYDKYKEIEPVVKTITDKSKLSNEDVKAMNEAVKKIRSTLI